MLQATDLNFNYRKKQVPAISGLSFSVAGGQVFALIGPNGAGKTTLVRILSGLIIPRSGRVTICGSDLAQGQSYAKRNLGIVLGDERTFYFRLSGYQNLAFFGGLLGLRRKDLATRIVSVLETVGLTEVSMMPYMALSSGMKKRLALARAMLHDPQVFLLDEPNSGVDPVSSLRIRKTIMKLRERGKAVLLTTHDMAEVERLADVVGFLRAGELVQVGPLSGFRHLIAQTAYKITLEPDTSGSLTPVANIAVTLEKHLDPRGVTVSGDSISVVSNGQCELNSALSVILHSGRRIRSVHTIEAALEDVFVMLARGL